MLAEEAEEKMYLFSAHKTNIAALLKCLDIFDPQIPPYGSYIAFEIHSIKDTIFTKV